MKNRTAWPKIAAISLATLLLPLLPSQLVAAAVNCPNGKQLNIVAHQDDDLLFLSPDLVNAVRGGKCVRTIFVTAGDANGDASYWQSRETGARAAYAKMANVVNSWTKSSSVFNNRSLAVSTLNTNPKLSLVFMRLPDGNGDGKGFSNNNYASLQKLWFGKIGIIGAVNGSASYNKAGLVNTLGAIMADYQTSDIRTQNYGGYFAEGDHSDHTAAAFFARLAQQQVAGRQLTGYLGYQSANRPVNVTGSNLTSKNAAFFAYGAFDDGVCGSWSACQGNMYGDWLQRQYVVARQTSGAPTPQTGTNVARQASVSASSDLPGSGQTAAKAIDGSAEGWPLDYSHEWSTAGQGAGAWLKLHWPSMQTVGRVVLYDRPNSDDHITQATLRFSDGTSQPVGSLNNNGWPVVINLPNKTTSDVRLEINTVSSNTANIGLAEIEVWSP